MTASAGSVHKDWLRALELTAPIGADSSRTLPRIIDDLADRYEEAPALLSEGECLSFRQLAQRAALYTRFALEQGLGKGDVVALLMEGRPEYMAIWLGLSRVGVVVALINTNLRGASLAHCVLEARCQCVIVSAPLRTSLAEAMSRFEAAPLVWVHGDGPGAGRRIDTLVSSYRPAGTPAASQSAVLGDLALLIYTSGTTGLPKAANVSHNRIVTWSFWFAGLTNAKPEDRLYDCLPLYHSIGGVVALGSMLVAGGSVAIRDRFSAKEFWEDVARWDCTCFQYIGELCRYLVTAPPHPKERSHRLRLACGNGLSSEVWNRFQDRFAIPRILEFYAATEGPFSLFNVEGRPGAVGRVPAFLAHRFPAAIVRYDTDRGAPVRDADGRCVRCAPGEPGEAIGRISGRSGAGRFEGYSDAAESEKKLLQDVFAPGDTWFRTGDLLRLDKDRFFYFVDRIGDTFRWKGENVATTEVAERLSAFPGIHAACVYGVRVPNAEGRAGMAALVADDDLDLVALRTHLASCLPAYALPVFLRLMGELPTTVTLKLARRLLVEEGFDPSRISDPLFVHRRRSGKYAPLDARFFSQIVSGRSPV